MGTRAGVAISHHRNPRVAGQEAAADAMRSGGIGRPTFVFVFASVGYPQDALVSAIREATFRAPLCGCSGEGIIANGEADESNFAVAVMVIESDELRFVNGLSEGLRGGALPVGAEVARALAPSVSPDAQALFLFADGLSFNFDAFREGFGSEPGLSQQIPFFGGTSADNWKLEKTYQYCDDRIATDGVAWALLSGTGRLVWAVNHGCLPIGLERKVTRSSGNVIYEIDGKPVLTVLQEYLVADEIENWQKAIVNLSLGFKAPGEMAAGYDDYLIRFMPSKDDAAGSVTISTDVVEGSSVWMTRRDQEKIAAGLDRMGAEVHEGLGGEPAKLVFQFDCAGRGKVVFRDQVKTELLRKLQSAVAPAAPGRPTPWRATPWMGFYSYGEIGPVAGENHFHNYTAVLLAIA